MIVKKYSLPFFFHKFSMCKKIKNPEITNQKEIILLLNVIFHYVQDLRNEK